MIVRDFTIDITRSDMIEVKWKKDEAYHSRYIRTTDELREFFMEKAHAAGIGVAGLRIVLSQRNV